MITRSAPILPVKRKSGFTLVEISVGAAISIVIFSVIYNILFATLNQEKGNERMTTILFEARKTMTQIQRELQEARIVAYPKANSMYQIATGQFVIYRDELNVIKCIYLDPADKSVKIFQVETTGAGNIKVLDRILGRNVQELNFSRDVKFEDNIQIRVTVSDYHIVAGVTILNVAG